MEDEELNKQIGTIVGNSEKRNPILGFFGDHARILLPALLGIFIGLIILLFAYSTQSEQYLGFCKENGYFSAGMLKEKLVCFNYTPEKITYWAFECAPDCAFYGEPGFIVKDYDANDVQLNLT